MDGDRAREVRYSIAAPTRAQGWGELHAHLVINPPDLIHVDPPPVAPQHNVDAPVAIAHPPLDRGLIRPLGLGVVGGGAKQVATRAV